MEKENQQELVSSVLKVFAILDALSEQKDIGITELSQRIMMSKSTTYRFLQTMKTLGFVSQEGELDKYGLTLKLFELGSRALEYIDLITLADKEMRFISSLTNETLHLGVLDNNEIVYLHKLDSTYNLRMYSRVGRRNPVYSTAIGKILLSNYSNEIVSKMLSEINFIASTPNTHRNVDELLNELDLVRKHHYAEDKEEQELGLRCIAVPIYDRFEQIIASISISIPTIRFKKEELHYLIELLHKAAAKISTQLGFHDYPITYSNDIN